VRVGAGSNEAMYVLPADNKKRGFRPFFAGFPASAGYNPHRSAVILSIQRRARWIRAEGHEKNV
jgi:hypothetical protein